MRTLALSPFAGLASLAPLVAGFLVVLFAGPGPASVDRALGLDGDAAEGGANTSERAGRRGRIRA